MKIEIEIDDKLIRNLLCCAFEGGSNYWYLIEKPNLRPDLTLDDFGEGGKMQVDKSYWHWSQLVPLVEGCSLTITTKDGDKFKGKKRWKLDRAAIQRGFTVLQKESPQQFANAISENEDAITGDALLQCALFGEIVYG